MRLQLGRLIFMNKAKTPFAIEQLLKRNIPITEHLQFSILEMSDAECILNSKLAANINHKGTVFGGSQYALCATAAYAFLTYWLEVNNIHTENIVISEGSIRYRFPIACDFQVKAKFFREADCTIHFSQGKLQRKLIFHINCEVQDLKNCCSEFKSRFVVQF